MGLIILSSTIITFSGCFSASQFAELNDSLFCFCVHLILPKKSTWFQVFEVHRNHQSCHDLMLRNPSLLSSDAMLSTRTQFRMLWESFPASLWSFCQPVQVFLCEVVNCSKKSMLLSIQGSHLSDCEYVTSPLRPSLSKGCAKYCNTTKQVREELVLYF